MVFSEVVNFSICQKPVVNIHLDKHNNSGQPGRRILERTPQQVPAYVPGGFGDFFVSGS